MAGIMRWLVIGGTTESVDAVKYLVSKRADVTVSVATDMGAALYVDFSVKLWVGYLNQDQFTKKYRFQKSPMYWMPLILMQWK